MSVLTPVTFSMIHTGGESAIAELDVCHGSGGVFSVGSDHKCICFSMSSIVSPDTVEALDIGVLQPYNDVIQILRDRPPKA
ncbi:MAG: hypothetical protein JSV21_08020 [Nitrospirota bacterium]|nr:MAG: hypothetical protein JSV21_08020 [Nitrospirota bacterium]